MFNKKGVSLITVLMFMLVATIAATAVFKLLTSENRSSASRMVMQESYQSAVAGIQSARAWITNNGNDVGAVIRQYMRTASNEWKLPAERNPILLDNIINPMADTNKQNFHVWLTGVSTNSASGDYKLKILSEGIARNNSKHTEVAILNVSGLYQVKRPDELPKKKRINFDYTYFGGSVRNNGKVKISSMLINGDWHGNPIEIDKNIIITGSANLSGSYARIKGTGCIGGKFNADNGFDAENIYVGDTLKRCGYVPSFLENGITVYGKGITKHAYFDGVVIQDQNRPIKVGGNLTVNDLFRTNNENGEVLVEGNLCVGPEGHVLIGDAAMNDVQKPFTVKQNVWAKSRNSFYAKGKYSGGQPRKDFSDQYTLLLLGDSSISELYIPDAFHSSNYETLRDNNPDAYVDVSTATDMYYFYDDSRYHSVSANSVYQYNDGQKKRSPYCDGTSCHVSPWFKSKSSHVSRSTPSPAPDTSEFCASSVKQFCDDIWVKKPGCDNAKYKVDDILVSAYEKFKTYAQWGCSICELGCDGFGKREMDADFADDLNTCYANLNANDKKKLYNGYLVVSVKSSQLVQEYNNNNRLKGKYIIILEDKPNHEIVFPPTKDDTSFVFVYLKKGATKIQSLQGPQPFNPPNNMTPTDITYNYFFYTKGHVGTSVKRYENGNVTIQPYTDGFLFKNVYFKGSIYAVAENCVKLASIDYGRPMEYNDALLQSLTDSEIICPTPDFDSLTCGGPASSSSSSAQSAGSASSDDVEDVSKDPYYISIAPQLNVTLESQYKATEAIPNVYDSTISPSLIVIPRIIYLTKDASGKLIDYYSVLSLNGGPREKKANGSVSCSGPGAIRTGKDELLFANATDSLSPGNYKCKYTPQNSVYDTIPFYVVVNDANNEMPAVSFKEPLYEELNLNVNTMVAVQLGRAKDNRTIKFNISFDNTTGFEITPLARVTETFGGETGKRNFTVEVTPNTPREQSFNLFKISRDASAEGNLTIRLESPTEYCQLGQNQVKVIHATDVFATIQRGSVSDYCNNYHNCSDKLQEDGKLRYYLDPCNEADIDQRWVAASGDDCVVKDGHENNEWKCKTNLPISLSFTAGNVPEDCEISRTPLESVSNPSAETYSLYASIVPKNVELELKVKGEPSNVGTLINAQQQYMGAQNHSCHRSSCSFDIYKKVPTEISLNVAGEDESDFRGWKICDDGENNCQSLNREDKDTTLTFYEKKIIIADFTPAPASHCYYDDFRDTYAFCSFGDTNCIANQCYNNLQPCLPQNSELTEAHWLMSYYNKGSGYEQPIFRNGNIFASREQNKPSIILRNKAVGKDGTMFSLVQTGILNKANSRDLLNSGLIFRSNGNEHLLLNMFGKAEADKSVKLKFRVCRITGQSITKEGGNCKNVETAPAPGKIKMPELTITNNSFVKLRFVIDGDSLKVTAKVGSDSWEAKVKLEEREFGKYNDDNHKYVGFSLADPDFRIYDNGWLPLGQEDCDDLVPSVTCNFDNYGQFVPQNEFVSPYVFKSKWFRENNCESEFYYNGCDNETNSCDNGVESPGEIGQKINDDRYYFTSQGRHGIVDSDNKLTKAAFVKMVCPEEVGSVDFARDGYSCGKFYVGPRISCTKNFEIANATNVSMSIRDSIEYDIPESERNMYGSKIKIEINNRIGIGLMPVPMGQISLKIQLVDINGIKSLSRIIDGSRSQEISIDWITANSISFDPRNVSKVIISNTGTMPIYLNSLVIQSVCENNSVLDLVCPPDPIDVQDANNDIVVEDVITTPFCGENCSYSLYDGSVPITIDLEHFTTKTTVTFRDPGVTESKGYMLRAEDGTTGEKDSCIFVVSVIPPSSSSNNISSSSSATLSITCPNSILNQNPAESIVLQGYGATPCGSGCTYKIYDIADGLHRDFSGNSFNDLSATGQKTYRLEAENSDGQTGSCTFNVTFVKPEIVINCPSDIIGQDPGSAISVSGASVQNCDPCTFKVLLGNSEKTSGSDINSLSFTETAANATGEKTYTVKAIDKNDNTRSNSCTFKVTFSSSSAVELVTFTYKGSAEVFKSGKTYKVNCSDGSLICTAPVRDTKIYINDVLKFTSLDWQEGQYPDGYQSVEQCSNINNAKVTVTGDMKCRNDW